MAYRQSAKDTHQLTPKQATGHTLQIVTTIQTTQAEAMAARAGAAELHLRRASWLSWVRAAAEERPALLAKRVGEAAAPGVCRAETP